MPEGAAGEMDVVGVLAGRWRVAATTLPLWLDGRRRHPWIVYTPLDDGRMRDEVVYLDPTERERRIVGTDTVRGTEVQWRMHGPLGLVARSRWRITGTTDGGRVIAIAYDRTIATPAGVDVLEREGATAETRRVVATAADELGMTAETFASLTWIDR